MRVLMVTDFYPPLVGGVEIAVRNLAVALGERGHEVSVATIQTDGLPESEEDEGVRIHRIRCTVQRVDRLFSQRRPWAPPAPDPEAVVGLRRIARRERPHVVHGHDWLARSFVPAKRSTDARFVMSLHYYTVSCAKKSLMYKDAPCTGPRLLKCLRCGAGHYGALRGFPIVLGNFAGAAAERAAVDLFIPVSTATATGNGLVGSGEPYEVIPNFVLDAPPPPAEALPLLERLPQEDFLLFVGDLRRDKGIGVLLTAYSRMTDAPPLVVIGEAWSDSPSEWPPNVHVLREWPHPAIRAAQRRCVALIAPSIWPEPFGLVIAEALAAGRPVIASRIGGITDLVQDGVNGFVTPPGDANALRLAVQSVVTNPALRAKLGRNAAQSAAAFRADAVVPRIERAYERVLATTG